jgi:hypothetical protein
MTRLRLELPHKTSSAINAASAHLCVCAPPAPPCKPASLPPCHSCHAETNAAAAKNVSLRHISTFTYQDVAPQATPAQDLLALTDNNGTTCVSLPLSPNSSWLGGLPAYLPTCSPSGRRLSLHASCTARP